MPDTQKTPEQINRYNIITTSFSTALSVATLFSVGASVRHQPVRKGALTALAGGAIVGAIVGMIGAAIGVKQKNSSFSLKVTAFILEEALIFASMPMGELVVPFSQNLSLATKIEDQLVGAAIFISPAMAILLLTACCFCCIAAQDSELRQGFIDMLKQQSSTAELIFALAELAPPLTVEAQVVGGHNPSATTLPVATEIDPQNINVEVVDDDVESQAVTTLKA